MAEGWYGLENKAKLGLLLESMWEYHGRDPKDPIVQCPCSTSKLQNWKRDQACPVFTEEKVKSVNLLFRITWKALQIFEGGIRFRTAQE